MTEFTYENNKSTVKGEVGRRSTSDLRGSKRSLNLLHYSSLTTYAPLPQKTSPRSCLSSIRRGFVFCLTPIPIKDTKIQLTVRNTTIWGINAFERTCNPSSREPGTANSFEANLSAPRWWEPDGPEELSPKWKRDEGDKPGSMVVRCGMAEEEELGCRCYCRLCELGARKNRVACVVVGI